MLWRKPNAAMLCCRPSLRALVWAAAAVALLALGSAAAGGPAAQAPPANPPDCGQAKQECCPGATPCASPGTACLPVLTNSSEPWAGELQLCMPAGLETCGQAGGPCSSSPDAWLPGAAPPCPEGRRRCPNG